MGKEPQEAPGKGERGPVKGRGVVIQVAEGLEPGTVRDDRQGIRTERAEHKTDHSAGVGGDQGVVVGEHGEEARTKHAPSVM